ncbi:MAG: hypothetical protein Q8L06_02825 [Pseudohongiella sp.]|nr:hypothetical protein [Pseudohongiella sp.]
MNNNEPDQQTEASDNGFVRNTLRTLRSGENPVHLFAAVTGFIVSSGVSLASGVSLTSEVPVAWASIGYYIFGLPLMCLVIYLLARAYPVRAWRWTLSMMLGQVFSSIFFGAGHMLPVAMIYVTVLSVPQFYVGTLGAKAGMRRRAANDSGN